MNICSSVNSEAMDNAAGMAESMNESSAILSGGEAVQGVIMKIKETEIEAVSFAYDSPKDGLSVSAFHLHTHAMSLK